MFVQSGQQYNECNSSFNENEHAPDCHGHCARITMTDTEVDLHNESQRWTQLDMQMVGIPKGAPGNGIQIDLLAVQVKLDALIQMLDLDEEEFDERIKKYLLDMLVQIRESSTTVTQPPLFLPDGFHNLN